MAGAAAGEAGRRAAAAEAPLVLALEVPGTDAKTVLLVSRLGVGLAAGPSCCPPLAYSASPNIGQHTGRACASLAGWIPSTRPAQTATAARY